MRITQEKYLEAANNNYKEWFVDNDYDLIFIPLIARDYLTAYLLNFTEIEYSAPEISYVLDKLSEYNQDIVNQYEDLNITFSGELKTKEYYLDKLISLKQYVNAELEKINRNDFSWIEKFSDFKIKDTTYNFKQDYPDNMTSEHKQLFEVINTGFIKLAKHKEILE